METTESRERVTRWLEDGQHLISAIPELAEHNEQLKKALEVAQRECEQLRNELTDLQSERNEVRESFGTFMSEMLRLMNGMVAKLQAPQRTSAFERETHARVS